MLFSINFATTTVLIIKHKLEAIPLALDYIYHPPNSAFAICRDEKARLSK